MYQHARFSDEMKCLLAKTIGRRDSEKQLAHPGRKYKRTKSRQWQPSLQWKTRTRVPCAAGLTLSELCNYCRPGDFIWRHSCAAESAVLDLQSAAKTAQRGNVTAITISWPHKQCNSDIVDLAGPCGVEQLSVVWTKPDSKDWTKYFKIDQRSLLVSNIRIRGSLLPLPLV